jgi:phosphoribosylaminoimidazole carboxylase (NCAIR synthetase)
VRKGRKLGHITLIGPDAAEVKAKAAQLITELHGV